MRDLLNGLGLVVISVLLALLILIASCTPKYEIKEVVETEESMKEKAKPKNCPKIPKEKPTRYSIARGWLKKSSKTPKIYPEDIMW